MPKRTTTPWQNLNYTSVHRQLVAEGWRKQAFDMYLPDAASTLPIRDRMEWWNRGRDMLCVYAESNKEDSGCIVFLPATKARTASAITRRN
jgi:hypothetical protein